LRLEYHIWAGRKHWSGGCGPFIGVTPADVAEVGLRNCDETRGQAVQQDGQDIMGLEPNAILDLSGRVGLVDARQAQFWRQHRVSDAGASLDRRAEPQKIRKLSFQLCLKPKMTIAR